MRNIFKVSILTYIFLILAILSGYVREIIIAYIIIIIHELGHFLLMKYYKIKVNSINIYPYGGIIESDILINTNSLKVLIISLGGILIQLILFLIGYYLYKVNILNIYYYKIFIKINAFIMLFNLLPLYPLDGFKIINSLLELFYSYKLSIVLSIITNIVFIIIFMIYLYINNISNYVIIMFLIVNLIRYLKSIKYLINKFYLERIIYDLNYHGLVSIANKNNMFKNKFNYINGIREDVYLKSIYFN